MAGGWPLTRDGWPFDPDVFEIWSTVTHQRLRRVEAPKPGSFGMRNTQETTCSVRLSQDGSLLATSGDRVNVWETDSGRLRRRDPCRPEGWLSQLHSALTAGNSPSVVEGVRSFSWIWLTCGVRPRVRRTLADRQTLDDPHPLGDSEAARGPGCRFFGGRSRDCFRRRQSRGCLGSGWGQTVEDLEGHDASVAGLAVRGSLIYSSDMLGQIRAWSFDGPPAVARFDGSSFNPHITVSTAGTYPPVEGWTERWMSGTWKRTVAFSQVRPRRHGSRRQGAEAEQSRVRIPLPTVVSPIALGVCR